MTRMGRFMNRMIKNRITREKNGARVRMSVGIFGMILLLAVALIPSVSTTAYGTEDAANMPLVAEETEEDAAEETEEEAAEGTAEEAEENSNVTVVDASEEEAGEKADSEKKDKEDKEKDAEKEDGMGTQAERTENMMYALIAMLLGMIGFMYLKRRKEGRDDR